MLAEDGACEVWVNGWGGAARCGVCRAGQGVGETERGEFVLVQRAVSLGGWSKGGRAGVGWGSELHLVPFHQQECHLAAATAAAQFQAIIVLHITIFPKCKYVKECRCPVYI